MLWYSLQAPRQGTSKEYSQHMFSSRNEKNIDTFGWKTRLIKNYAMDESIIWLIMPTLVVCADSEQPDLTALMHCLYIHNIRVGIWLIFFLFLHENICCGYSLEVPHQGASNGYPQHKFSCRNKKNIDTFGLKKNILLRAMLTFRKCIFFNQKGLMFSDFSTRTYSDIRITLSRRV